MPTTVQKPREQITETDLRYLLTIQLSGLIKKEGEATQDIIEEWESGSEYNDEAYAFAEAVIEKYIDCYTVSYMRKNSSPP